VTYEARSKIPERQDDLENAFKKCNGKIEESFKVIHSVVDQLKAKAIADLERNRAEKSEYYENLYQKIDSQYGKIQDAIQ
jgi:hypothetical protein